MKIPCVYLPCRLKTNTRLTKNEDDWAHPWIQKYEQYAAISKRYYKNISN